MRYRKKPVIIEAMQFTDENKDRVFHWVTHNLAKDAYEKAYTLIEEILGK